MINENPNKRDKVTYHTLKMLQRFFIITMGAAHGDRFSQQKSWWASLVPMMMMMMMVMMAMSNVVQVISTTFMENYGSTSDNQHLWVLNEGQQVQLVLDQSSGG